MNDRVTRTLLAAAAALACAIAGTPAGACSLMWYDATTPREIVERDAAHLSQNSAIIAEVVVEEQSQALTNKLGLARVLRVIKGSVQPGDRLPMRAGMCEAGDGVAKGARGVMVWEQPDGVAPARFLDAVLVTEIERQLGRVQGGGTERGK